MKDHWQSTLQFTAEGTPAALQSRHWSSGRGSEGGCWDTLTKPRTRTSLGLAQNALGIPFQLPDPPELRSVSNPLPSGLPCDASSLLGIGVFSEILLRFAFPPVYIGHWPEFKNDRKGQMATGSARTNVAYFKI